mmetsp:Transcript_26087/g.37093  ORF Transcript_26087/g.37093 Transcript_26087/m.37093 type:complete len:160 (+) Transcript_26087:210-689(+)
MTVTFKNTLTIYRTAVNTKFPNGQQTTGPRRHGISEVGRGRGGRGGRGNGGKGYGGRGNRQQNRQNLRHQGGGQQRERNHQDQETITLRNGDRIDYHSSYHFTNYEMDQMTQGQKDCLTRERSKYRERNNGPNETMRFVLQHVVDIMNLTVNNLKYSDG